MSDSSKYSELMTAIINLERLGTEVKGKGTQTSNYDKSIKLITEMNATKKLNEKPSERVIDEFSILLLYACTYDKKPDTPVIAKLIDSGAEVNSYDAGGLTPLNYACGSGNTYAVKLLIERGAAVDLPEDDKRNNNNTPLLMACSLSSGGTQNRITGKFVPFLPDYDTIPEILIKNGARFFFAPLTKPFLSTYSFFSWCW